MTAIASVNLNAAPERASLDPERVSERFIQMIPRDFAREHLIVSQGMEGKAETLAVSDRTDAAAIHNVRVMLGSPVKAHVASAEDIARVIDTAYAGQLQSSPNGTRGRSTGDDIEQGQEGKSDVDRLLAQADRDLLSTQGKGPVVKLVDALRPLAERVGALAAHAG
jgi:type II secretory ATPase GspE/PulE/Tfp pilus assembly ATPase PilB-like protein